MQVVCGTKILILIWLLAHACVWAAGPLTTPRSIPFRNYTDLGFDGYCLGVTTLNGLGTLSPERLNHYFGSDLAHSIEKAFSGDQGEATKLIRLFSVLQVDAGYEDLITRESITFPRKEVGVRFLEELHQMVQAKEGLDGRGAFLNAEIEGLPFTFSEKTFHSIYVFDSSVSSEAYVFYFLDPNQPGIPHELKYEIKNQQFSSSRDKVVHGHPIRLIPASAYSKKSAATFFRKALDRIKQQETPADRAFAAYFGFGGSDRFEQAVYGSGKVSIDDEVYAAWKRQLYSAIEGKNREVQKEEASKQYLGLVYLAAQAQLDRGCANFTHFVQRVVKDLLTEAEKDPSPYSRTDKRPLFVLSKSLLDNMTLLSISEKVLSRFDSDTVGEVPVLTSVQAKCVSETVLPSLANSASDLLDRQPQLWRALFNAETVIWLVNHYQWDRLPPEKIKEGERFIQQIRLDILLKVVKELSLSDDPLSRKQAVDLLLRLKAMQPQYLHDWQREVNGIPDPSKFSAHRGVFLWQAFEEMNSPQREGFPHQVVQLWREWLTNLIQFLKTNKLDGQEFFESERIPKNLHPYTNEPVEYLLKTYSWTGLRR